MALKKGGGLDALVSAGLILILMAVLFAAFLPVTRVLALVFGLIGAGLVIFETRRVRRLVGS